MFKKTIIALSLLGVASHGAASTLSITGGEKVLTPQAATTVVEVVANPTKLTTAQASIASGAIAKFTYTKAPTNAAAITTAVSANNGAGGACGALSYSGASNSGKTLNYTTTGITTAACTITLTGAKFAIADISTTAISVSASFTDVGDGIDPATAKEIISLTAADQFSLTMTTKADAIVDVESDRYDFVPNAADTIVFALADTNGTVEVNTAAGAQNGTITGAALTGVTYAIDGNFAWAEAVDEVAGFQLAAGAVACTGGGVIAEGTGTSLPTASSYTFTATTKAAVTCTLTPQANAKKISLPTDDFDVSATAAFTDLGPANKAGTQAVASKDAGEWGINGASVKIFAVPFGSEVESHSIFVSNSGDATGAITGSMVWNGNDAVTFSLGNIQAGANKYLNVIDALTAAGEKPPFGRADITFTVNAPAADITFTAAYNTAEGRANLYMQQQSNLFALSNAAKTSSASADTQATTAATQATTAATQSTAAAVDAAANEVLATCVKTALASGNATAVTQSATTIAADQIKFNCD